MIRSEIRTIIESINPLDALEATHQAQALDWIDSGAGLFRTQKPATPDPHLVSYFIVIDRAAGKILLVDHKNARLWLPSGGHVEPNEHPLVTVEREVVEELNMQASFFSETPLFITVTPTVGVTAGHTDVSLWYVLLSDADVPIQFDEHEFFGVRWFAPDEIPYARADPHLQRFVMKLNLVLDNLL